MTDRIDRYVRGELSPEEARALAQASLDSPELFDELTDAALAKAALNPRTVRSASVVRDWRKTAVIAGGLAAAAALVLISLPHRPSTGEPNVKPVLALSSGAGQPVLLATGLQPANAPVFRGGEPDGRPPQAAGSIVSIAGGNANISLGSLDGLAKGSELQVYRGAELAGRLQATTVFRDRARARVIEGNLRPKDEVRVARRGSPERIAPTSRTPLSIVATRTPPSDGRGGGSMGRICWRLARRDGRSMEPTRRSAHAARRVRRRRAAPPPRRFRRIQNGPDLRADTEQSRCASRTAGRS